MQRINSDRLISIALLLGALLFAARLLIRTLHPGRYYCISQSHLVGNAMISQFSETEFMVWIGILCVGGIIISPIILLFFAFFKQSSGYARELTRFALQNNFSGPHTRGNLVHKETFVSGHYNHHQIQCIFNRSVRDSMGGLTRNLQFIVDSEHDSTIYFYICSGFFRVGAFSQTDGRLQSGDVSFDKTFAIWGEPASEVLAMLAHDSFRQGLIRASRKSRGRSVILELRNSKLTFEQLEFKYTYSNAAYLQSVLEWLCGSLGFLDNRKELAIS